MKWNVIVWILVFFTFIRCDGPSEIQLDSPLLHSSLLDSKSKVHSINADLSIEEFDDGNVILYFESSALLRIWKEKSGSLGLALIGKTSGKEQYLMSGQAEVDLLKLEQKISLLLQDSSKNRISGFSHFLDDVAPLSKAPTSLDNLRNPQVTLALYNAAIRL